MIKLIELDTKEQVLDKLNEWRATGWALKNVYNRIVPTLDGKFLVYYDEILDKKI